MGVTTDSYGAFSIDNVDDKAILIISGVGNLKLASEVK